MSEIPTPGDVARFGRSKPSLPPEPPEPSPTGWNDNLDLPLMDRHFFLDTGIFHSMAGVEEAMRSTLVACVDQHERNPMILTEVRTQKDEPLCSKHLKIIRHLLKHARNACYTASQHLDCIETIRNELIADAQLRHPQTPPAAPSSQHSHGGEAELIHLAELHEPIGALGCNDAGASAIANIHGVESFHFVHVVRAAVRDGLSPDAGLAAAQNGLKVSKLEAAEQSRTCNQEWLTS